MKQFFYLLLFLGVAAPSLRAQSVASSCEANDSLEAYYDFDATKLAIRYLYDHNLSASSDIVVDSVYKAPVLRALLAVNQAYQLAARDEVVVWPRYEVPRGSMWAMILVRFVGSVVVQALLSVRVVGAPLIL